MFLRLLSLALLGAPAVSAAPVRPSPSTSEPTKVTVMVTSTVTVQAPTSTMDTNLQARQWEWTPSAPAWSEPVWTQPAWSDSAVVPASTEPVWTPSMSYSYTEESAPAPTSTSSWIETHRPDPSATKTGVITAICVLAGIFGLSLIWFLWTMFRRYLHKRAPLPPLHNASDVEVSAGLHRNSQAPASSTPPGPATDPITEPSGSFYSTPVQSQDFADTPRLADPLDGLTRGPRRLSSVYQNNIPPQETHWPLGETEQYTTWTRGTGYRES